MHGGCSEDGFYIALPTRSCAQCTTVNVLEHTLSAVVAELGAI